MYRMDGYCSKHGMVLQYTFPPEWKDGLKNIIFADNASFQQTREFHVACRKELNAPVCMLSDNHTDKIEAIDVGKWTHNDN